MKQEELSTTYINEQGEPEEANPIAPSRGYWAAMQGDKIQEAKWIRLQSGDFQIISVSSSQKKQVDLSVDPQKASDFYFYKKKWEEEIAGLSSPRSISLNRNYQKIISLGKSILPLIITELKREPDYWFYALEIIVDDEENPVTDDMGFKESVNAWIKWGEKRGYI